MSVRISQNKKNLNSIGCVFRTDSNVTLGNVSDNLFEVFSSNNKANFNLHVEAELPDSWEDLFTKPERKKPPYLVGLVYESKDSRRADFINLSQVSGNNFSGKLPIDFDNWRGRINLKVVLLRSKTIPRVQGFLTNEYSELANSEEYILDITEKETSNSGGSLKVEFKSFSNMVVDGETGFAKDSVYFLDTSEDIPVVSINSDLHQSILSMFEKSGRNTRITTLRDAIFSGIETDIWEQLATISFQEIRDTENLSNFEELEMPYSGICKAIASFMFPGMDDQDAESELIDLCTSDNDAFKRLLNQRLPVAVQKKTKLAKSITKIASWEES
tara:strand:- start:2845 stop:3834 length:990 start_codon:yes stop_codon:yes gene_type:complete